MPITPKSILNNGNGFRTILKENTNMYEPLITMIIPNPKGRDEGKTCINLINKNEYDIDITDYRIETRYHAYTFKNVLLKSSSSKLICKIRDQNIHLENTNEAIALINSDDVIIQRISYARAREGEIFILNNSNGLFESNQIDIASSRSSNPKLENNYIFKDFSEQILPISINSSNHFDHESVSANDSTIHYDYIIVTIIILLSLICLGLFMIFNQKILLLHK